MGLRVLVCGAAALVLAACASNDVYKPPTLAPEAAATLSGSKYKIDSHVPDTRVYLVKLDGLLTVKSNQWDEQTVMAPGEHTFTIGVSQKAVLNNEAWGFATIQAKVEAGKTYHLRAKPITASVSPCAITHVWIEAEDGSPISRATPLMLHEYGGASGYADCPTY